MAMQEESFAQVLSGLQVLNSGICLTLTHLVKACICVQSIHSNMVNCLAMMVAYCSRKVAPS